MIRLINHLLRKDVNPLKTGNNLFLTYTKPVSDWTPEERKNYAHLIDRPTIIGLPKLKVKATAFPDERASLSEVFRNAQEQVTELKFGES
jgi:hypothetical protein